MIFNNSTFDFKIAKTNKKKTLIDEEAFGNSVLVKFEEWMYLTAFSFKIVKVATKSHPLEGRTDG